MTAALGILCDYMAGNNKVSWVPVASRRLWGLERKTFLVTCLYDLVYAAGRIGIHSSARRQSRRVQPALSRGAMISALSRIQTCRHVSYRSTKRAYTARAAFRSFLLWNVLWFFPTSGGWERPGKVSSSIKGRSQQPKYITPIPESISYIPLSKSPAPTRFSRDFTRT
ncbi:hypothetical protein AG1IA_02192 [Rhizoctonia solani AG-1 IA]|uniref:Uncharacterized protein n=1 Tax=Thanatephorus cucumeris (strain AG1-IA) TaxID=983506 RepID=L8X590_THACA|nr:hypothetical protein AG1IA_02192 [Rhizoctonia solani AG-1 IA]